jgi:SAM-dependent methyltransferase
MRKLARRIYETLNPPPPPPPVPDRFDKLDYRATYLGVVAALERVYGPDEAMRRAVGGEFEGIGFLELETLRHFGLRQDAYLIDVGCGSGRLAKPLSGYLTGRYLGIDVVPALLEHAKQIVSRPEWRFERAAGLTIPEADNSADFVCFFSVLTHLLHEQSFLYLRDAKRVLKPGGTIVFSFLDYTIESHWDVFEITMTDVDVNAQHLNVFMSKDGLAVWAERLGMQLVAIHDGDEPYVPLSRPVVLENGRRVERLGSVGQSVCVLRKPL